MERRCAPCSLRLGNGENGCFVAARTSLWLFFVWALGRRRWLVCSSLVICVIMWMRRWVATVGMVLALSRAFIIESSTAFDPEVALMGVVAHTHYLPGHWRGR